MEILLRTNEQILKLKMLVHLEREEKLKAQVQTQQLIQRQRATIQQLRNLCR